jgi:glutamyl-Q tRNA(Asp) synthetase
MREVGRFAPSTTGLAHPGTLLAALLCWLDCRSVAGKAVMRLENCDPERCKNEYITAMIADVQWLGLTFDHIEIQSDAQARHAAAMDYLATQKLLYPSAMSRRELEMIGRRAPDGGWAYPNSERGRPLPAGGWRACAEPIRVQLPDISFHLRDELGNDLSQNPALAFGDPIVRRRDGAFAYHLVAVVDDAAVGVTRVVRGRDLITSTATQIALQHVLGYSTPTYRHHFLLLEQRAQKFAKLHGSVNAAELRAVYSGAALCGWLAWCAGLLPQPTPCRPEELVRDYNWERVRRDDVLVAWNGQALHLEKAGEIQ